MSHSLIPSPHAPTPISTRPSKKTPTLPVFQSQRHYITCNHAPNHQATSERLCIQSGSHYRRMFVWGLTGAVLGLIVGNQDANAAKRKSPPAPEERKDPNVSGVQAKVLASMKRKEAMKEAMAKLREKGKPINE